MSKVASILNMGVRSLRNNQMAMQTASHNIASKSVPGYSRQEVSFNASAPDVGGKFPIGKGSYVSSLKRQSNPYLERQIVSEENKFGYSKGSSDTLLRVEQVFNQMDRGLNESMVDFFNAFRDLSRQPESFISKTLVRQKAERLIQDFRETHGHLEEVQKDIRFQISKLLLEINGITKEIVSLNTRIQSLESVGNTNVTANDERDRRDFLLKKLGSYVDIRYFENKYGSLMVTAGKSLVLVSGSESLNLLASPSGQGEKNPDKREGSLDIFYEKSGGRKNDLVTNQFSGGKMGALLRMQNEVVNSLQNDIDELAYTFGKKVNDIHQSGYDFYNKKGEVFFTLPLQMREAAMTMDLNENLRKDLRKIVAAAEPNAPADNRVANEIASLQHKKIMKNGQYSMGDFYRSLVGNVGLWTEQANLDVASQKNVLRQLESLREKISGVSVDEETAKIVEYQKNYEASARLMQVANELLDTILSIKA